MNEADRIISSENIKDELGREKSVSLEYPDQCPVCHRYITPDLMKKGSIYTEELRYSKRRYFQLLFICPSSQCGQFFISTFMENEVSAGKYIWSLESSLPRTPVQRAFPKEVTGISNKFEKIFNQAQEAESRNLDEISGMGYRKALEFLIKDYASFKKPKDKKVIEEQFLGSCIKEYFKGELLEQTAKRAAWLGNDQSHYVKLWGDLKLEHLKDLIEITVDLIHSELKAKKYIETMPDKKKL